jgi:hypothetical protein
MLSSEGGSIPSRGKFWKDESFSEYGYFGSGNGGSSFYLIHAKNPIKKA